MFYKVLVYNTVVENIILGPSAQLAGEALFWLGSWFSTGGHLVLLGLPYTRESIDPSSMKPWSEAQKHPPGMEKQALAPC
jgi:hypothetical protein